MIQAWWAAHQLEFITAGILIAIGVVCWLIYETNKKTMRNQKGNDD